MQLDANLWHEELHIVQFVLNFDEKHALFTAQKTKNT